MLTRVSRVSVALVVVGLATGGCGGDDEDEGGARDRSRPAEQVTLTQYHQIKEGWSREDVRSLVADPKRTDTTKVKNLGRSECWYYGGELPEPTTKICFKNGRVAFKTQYVKKSRTE